MASTLLGNGVEVFTPLRRGDALPPCCAALPVFRLRFEAASQRRPRGVALLAKPKSASQAPAPNLVKRPNLDLSMFHRPVNAPQHTVDLELTASVPWHLAKPRFASGAVLVPLQCIIRSTLRRASPQPSNI